MIRAFACVIAGAVILVACGVLDARDAVEPWREGFAFIGPDPDWPDVIPFVETTAQVETRAPRLISYHALFIEFSDSDWESILADGRVPRVGEREALAGVLCGFDSFTVGGETYTVTGRIRRGVPCFSTAFAVPYDETTAESVLANASGRRGLYVRNLRALVTAEDFERPDDVEPLFVHDAVPMRPGLPFAMVAGLVLTLYGASVLQWRGLAWFSGKTGAFSGVVAAARQYPSLFRAVYLLNYSVFIVVMIAGLFAPLANLAASQWVFEQFSDGGLKELGAAYADGNIPLAAWETFRNNFVLQTFILAMLPSLVVPLWGVGKNLLSLIVVGFAMAPVWAGGAVPMTFHWLTIALELQAYILVSFGICVYTLHLWRAYVALAREPEDHLRRAWSEFRFGFEALAAATMYACLALAIAAIYEAVTLIGLSAGLAA